MVVARKFGICRRLEECLGWEMRCAGALQTRWFEFVPRPGTVSSEPTREEPCALPKPVPVLERKCEVPVSEPRRTALGGSPCGVNEGGILGNSRLGDRGSNLLGVRDMAIVLCRFRDLTGVCFLWVPAVLQRKISDKEFRLMLMLLSLQRIPQ